MQIVQRRTHDADQRDNPGARYQDEKENRLLHVLFEMGREGKQEYGDAGGQDDGIPDEPGFILDLGSDPGIEDAEQRIDQRAQDNPEPKLVEGFFKIVLSKIPFQFVRKPQAELVYRCHFHGRPLGLPPCRL